MAERISEGAQEHGRTEKARRILRGIGLGVFAVLTGVAIATGNPGLGAKASEGLLFDFTADGILDGGSKWWKDTKAAARGKR